jgi:hypothetical protein
LVESHQYGVVKSCLYYQFKIYTRQLLSLAEAAGLIERVTRGGRRVLNPAGIWTGAAGGAAPHGSASSGRGAGCLALPRAA